MFPMVYRERKQKNTQKGQALCLEKKNIDKGQKARKAIIIVLCCLVGLVLVLLLGIRGYFRIPVSEYYKNSEKRSSYRDFRTV